MRIRNLNYAAARLIGAAGALSAVGLIAYMAGRTDPSWWTIALAGAVVVSLAAWACVVALRAAWWVEIRGEGIRVRFLLGRRELSWDEVAALRLTTETTYVDQGFVDVPWMRHRALEIALKDGRRVVVLVNRREREALKAILGEEQANGDPPPSSPACRAGPQVRSADRLCGGAPDV